jgi:hypothetical protein
MKQFILVFWGALLPLYSIFAQSELTISTYKFEQIGAKINIIFKIPPSKGYQYNIAKVILFGEKTITEIQTYSGEKENLNEGEEYILTWDVSKDTDVFDQPISAEIALKYTEESQKRWGEELDKENREKAEKQRQDRLLKIKELNKYKPFRLSVFAQGGYANYTTTGHYELTFGYSYGGGVGFAFMVGKKKLTYIQIQAIYSNRVIEISPDFDISYNNDYEDFRYSISFPGSKFTLEEYRTYLKFKFGAMTVGGYMSLLQTANRTSVGDGYVNVSSNDSPGYDGSVYKGPLNYSLYTKDTKAKNQPLKQDYGFSFSFETFEKKGVLLGLGGDISIPNLLNQEYKWNHFGTQGNIDFVGSRYSSEPTKSELRWWMFYLKIGLRI